MYVVIAKRNAGTSRSRQADIVVVKAGTDEAALEKKLNELASDHEIIQVIWRQQ